MKNRVQTISSLLLCAGILMSVLCACARKQPPAQMTTSAALTNDAVITVDESTWKNNSISCYNRLSAEEQDVYKKIVQAIEERKSSISISLPDYRDMVYDKVYFYSVLPDNPQLIHVRANSEVLEDTIHGTQYAHFKLEYADVKETAQRYAEMQQVCTALTASLAEDADDFKKARAAYDYLIKHCDYDDSYTGNSLAENTTTASYADGALVDCKAVCTGYSRAFKWLMDAFHIECTCISNNEHEWNMVKIGGKYYHVDVTWADTETFSKGKYFCVSDATIYQNREKANGNLPACEDNY